LIAHKQSKAANAPERAAKGQKHVRNFIDGRVAETATKLQIFSASRRLAGNRVTLFLATLSF